MLFKNFIFIAYLKKESSKNIFSLYTFLFLSSMIFFGCTLGKDDKIDFNPSSIRFSGTIGTGTSESSATLKPKFSIAINKPVPNSTIEIYNIKGILLNSVLADKRGNFDFFVDKGTNYFIKGISDDGKILLRAYISSTGDSILDNIVVNSYSSAIVFAMESSFNLPNWTFGSTTSYDGNDDLLQKETDIKGKTEKLSNLAIAIQNDVTSETGNHFGLSVTAEGLLAEMLNDIASSTNNPTGNAVKGTNNLCEYSEYTVPKDYQYPKYIISAGESHSIALKNNGTVWSWGKNSHGQLGYELNSSQQNTIPKQLTNISGVIVSIVSGSNHVLALKEDGTVFTWGKNEAGQLGYGGDNDTFTPIQVKELNDETGYLTNIKSIGAGGSHSLAVKEDGTVWAWGANNVGQLGNSTLSLNNSNMAVQVDTLTKIVGVAAGGRHSLALKEDGTVWAWGDNESGQLGDTTIYRREIPVQVHALCNIKAIASGNNHNISIDNQGTVFTWGENVSAQLGITLSTKCDNLKSTYCSSIPIKVESIDMVKLISAGSKRSMVIKEDNTLWSWGFNGDTGELGIGESEPGNKNSYIPVKAIDLEDVSNITGGSQHSLALKIDGTLLSWGLNDYGQLGDETFFTNTIPGLVFSPPYCQKNSLGFTNCIAE